MDDLPAIVQKRMAQGFSDRAESDDIEELAVARAQPRPHMALPHRFGIGDGVSGDGEDRLRIAGSEGTGLGDGVVERGIDRARADRAIDRERVLAPRGFHGVGQGLFQIGAEWRERVLAQRHARRHRVSAALEQQAFPNRAPHRPAEIDPGDRTARARAGAVRQQRDGKGRTAETLSNT